MGVTASSVNLIRDSGFLYWNPTKVSNLGENLGYLKDGFAFFPNIKVTPIFYETTGLVPQDYIYSGCQYIAEVSFLEIKTTSLQCGFFQAITSGPSFSLPGSVVPGFSLSSGATNGVLLFVPENSTSHPCFYSTASAGVIQDSIRISNKNLTSLSVLFYCSDMRVGLLSTLLPA